MVGSLKETLFCGAAPLWRRDAISGFYTNNFTKRAPVTVTSIPILSVTAELGLSCLQAVEPNHVIDVTASVNCTKPALEHHSSGVTESSPTFISSATLSEHSLTSRSHTSSGADEEKDLRGTEVLTDPKRDAIIDLKPEPGTKLKLRRFARGSKTLHSCLPRGSLPCFLDPLYVDCQSPTDLPLVWYGLPFEKENILKYAKDNDILYTYPAPYSQESEQRYEVDFHITAACVKQHVIERYGTNVQVKAVFKAPMSHIFSFYSNYTAATIDRGGVDEDIRRFKKEFGINDEGWYLAGEWGLS
ncbi:hypothetical protein EVG20_g4224 [Dentipellis fragilis]|uniref:Uncharacterized protein n=1 Tax=Dentipellis fragilis TaxID=205917 RepID=A0A4Y9YZ59_9AGAM|nr:hypothetical protein EVG20_g4224 [Dentipellis fragilis]